MANLKLKGINKIYANGVQAVYDFNLDIKDGEFIVLVGPSGCGKSTTLRMIAGLEGISSGDLLLDGERINEKAPSVRDIAMVFQDYALYGHMTVYENMGFSLIVRKVKSDVIHEAVMNVAKIVGLEDFLNRYPKQLSGGQRQRVALGRAIVRNAKVFLMDEPLSNLDAKLRQQTRNELVVLHNKLKATIVYVTHDQVEAMTMATRIVVMKDGYIQQVGTPFEIYNYPENMFVASFIGTPQMNLIKGILINNHFIVYNEEENGEIEKRILLDVEIPLELMKLLDKYQYKHLFLGIRPEHLDVENDTNSHIPHRIQSTVDVCELLGSEIIVKTCVACNPVVAKVNAKYDIQMNQNISLVFDINKVHFFDEESTIRIR